MKPLLDLKRQDIDLPDSEPSLQLPSSGTQSVDPAVPSVVVEQPEDFVPPRDPTESLPSLYDDVSSSMNRRAATIVRVELRQKLRLSLFFRWYDMWVGLYWDRDKRDLYLCPLPMLGLKVSVPRRDLTYPLRRTSPVLLALLLSSMTLVIGLIIGLQIRLAPTPPTTPMSPVITSSTFVLVPERLRIPPPEPVPLVAPSTSASAVPNERRPARLYKPMPSEPPPSVEPIPNTRD
jgi:hypothetical protein